MTMQKEYVTVAQTAVLVRKALDKAFPGVKFYVRSKSYAGGASITVWYDGIQEVRRDADGWALNGGVVWKPGMPTSREVEDVVHGFEGRGFDGMIDLAYTKTAYMTPDGEVVGGQSGGTVGSRGSMPAYDTGLPEGAVPVHFGASYVFVTAELPYDVRVKDAKREEG